MFLSVYDYIDDLEKDSKFVFKADTHQYFYDSVELESVSTFNKNFYKEFDEEYWSKEKANSTWDYKYKNLNEDQIKTMWRLNSERACYIGHKSHEYMDKYLCNISYDLSWEEDVIRGRVSGLKEIYDQKVKPKLALAKSEFMIYNLRYGIAGTMDLLLLKNIDNPRRVIISDWKTNANLTTDFDSSYNMLLDPFTDQKENLLNKYSLQLCTYAIILEEAGLEVENFFIIHCGEDNKGKLLFCKDYRKGIREFLERRVAA